MNTYTDFSPIYSKSKLAGYKRVTDLDAIKNSLKNIFVIQKNDVPGKPWFGNPLQTEIFELFTQTTESTALSAIENAIAKFEPRVSVTNVNVTPSPELNRIIVELEYEVNSTNEILQDSVMLPFQHNDFSFLGGRDIQAIN